jgi:anti-sigma factor (TIGR02949 family)
MRERSTPGCSSSDCSSIAPLVTAYVDGELDPAERTRLEHHLDRCEPCRAGVGVERSVRDLLKARKPALNGPCAPGTLRSRCASLCRSEVDGVTAAVPLGRSPRTWPRTSAGTMPRPRRFFSAPPFLVRLAPLAAVAILVLIVGGAFVYRVTDSSPRLLAAELTADHVKCFAMNAVLRTQQSPAAVESSLASGFDWTVHLPEHGEREGIELVGSRPCLYGQGTVAHIMYRHNGRPVSLFMLPRSKRPDQLVEVLGHEAAIWSVGDRTFVLIAREGRSEVERMAAFVHAAMR